MAHLDKCSGSSPAGITFTYDAASNLTQYCDTGGNVNYAYDAANHNIGTATGSGSCTPGAVVQPCTTSAFNAGNEVTGITYPTSTGVIDTLGYDGAGNLTSTVVSKGSTNLEDLTYSYAIGTADKPLQQTMTNVTSGVATTYSYDNHDRLTAANTGTTATSQSYGYDTDGNLNTETLGGATKTLQYSASDALCWAVSGTSSNTCSSAPTGATTYTYDANGNQTSSSAGESISYNSVNQTTSMTPAGGSALSMTYTGTNSSQRTSAGTTAFANSLFGVASSTTGSTSTYFTHGAGGGLSSILVGSTRAIVFHPSFGGAAGPAGSGFSVIVRRPSHGAKGHDRPETGSGPFVSGVGARLDCCLPWERNSRQRVGVKRWPQAEREAKAGGGAEHVVATAKSRVTVAPPRSVL